MHELVPCHVSTTVFSSEQEAAQQVTTGVKRPAPSEPSDATPTKVAKPSLQGESGNVIILKPVEEVGQLTHECY